MLQLVKGSNAYLGTVKCTAVKRKRGLGIRKYLVIYMLKDKGKVVKGGNKMWRKDFRSTFDVSYNNLKKVS